jgi:hypothetical protein
MWWSKFELYTIKGPVFYFDLDTIILNNIDNYILSIKDSSFSCLTHRTSSAACTGMMYWKNDVSYIYKEWLKILASPPGPPPHVHDPSTFNKCIKLIFRGILKTSDKGDRFKGDQAVLRYIIDKTNIKWDPLPSKDNDVSDLIVSYKVLRESLEKGNSEYVKNFINTKKIVYFHGLPRPWEQNIIPY